MEHAPNPATPRHPSPWGTRALKTLVTCTLLGFPALLAFGLGVLIWAYGAVATTLLAVRGLLQDQHKGRAALALVLVVTLLVAGKPYQTQMYMRRQDGTDLWINVIGYVSNPENPAQGTVWLLEDRTDYKRVDDALRRSLDDLEERVAERTAELLQQLHFQQQLIEAIPGPVFYKDAQARYLGCNSAFEAFIGRPASELIGKTPHDIAPRELADRYLAADRELFDKPGSQIYESQVRFANGEMRDVIFHKATFTRPDGTVAGLVGLMLDITERKHLEDNLRQYARRSRHNG